MVVDAILLSTGRRPNVEGMGLETAGVEFDVNDGIIVNDGYLTSNKNVYSVGDCIAARYSNDVAQKKANPGTGPQFTHNSDV